MLAQPSDYRARTSKNQKLATFLSFGGLGWKMEDKRERDKIRGVSREVGPNKYKQHQACTSKNGK